MLNKSSEADAALWISIIDCYFCVYHYETALTQCDLKVS